MKDNKDLNYGLRGGSVGYTTKSYKKSINSYDKYHSANSEPIWTCNDCRGTKYPTWQQNGEKPDICDECMKIGWSEITSEDILNDPELKDLINIQSPIKFIDFKN